MNVVSVCWNDHEKNDKCDFVEEIGNKMKVNNIKFEKIAGDIWICEAPCCRYQIYKVNDSEYDVYADETFMDSYRYLKTAKTFVIQDLIRRYNELHSFLYEQNNTTP